MIAGSVSQAIETTDSMVCDDILKFVGALGTTPTAIDKGSEYFDSPA